MADNISGASLDGIFERLTSVPSYHPLEAETFADWSLEAGDIVTVSRDGKSYPSPVHTAALTWRGQPEITVNSSGNEERDPVAKVSKKKYNRGSGGIRNNLGFYNDVWAEDGHVHSVISQTASEITAFVEDVYDQMVSGLQLTSSSAALYVRDMYNQMTSGLALTSSSAAMYVHDMYNQLSAGLALTSSSAAIYVRDMYNQLCSGLELTSSTAAIYVRDMYNQLTSGLKLTSSTALLYVKDMYNQLVSGLKLTSSSAALYVQDMYKQMTSGLKLTSSSAAIYVRDMYRQMTAGLKITSSSITQYVTDSYNRMASGLYQTSSSLQATIVDAYNRLTSGLTLTNSAVRLYVNGRTTRAYIVAEINKGGSSEVLIGADQIQITGRTTLNDVMTISDSRVSISSPLRVVGNAMIESLTIRDGSSSSSLTQTNLAKLVGSSSQHGAVVSASVENNVLTLTHVDGTTVTFSKAASGITGGWGTWGSTIFKAVSGSDTLSTQLRYVRVRDESAGSTTTVSANVLLCWDGDPDRGEATNVITWPISVNATECYNYGKSAGGSLSAAWDSGKLTVTSGNGNVFTSTIDTYLTGNGYSSNFSAVSRSTDALGQIQTRASTYCYLFEVVNGTSSYVKACRKDDGSEQIAQIYTTNTYNAGYRVTQSQITCSLQARAITGSIGQREYIGAVSYSALAPFANTGYIVFDISAHGTSKGFYITINA